MALTLPVKLHLENPLLGSECYIGSNSRPLIWNLRTNTTRPPPPNRAINGKVGKVEEKDEGEFIEIAANTLVDNAFSSPSVSGCSGLISDVLRPIINAKLGLPAAAGHNAAILDSTIDLAAAESVKASEK